MEGFFLLEKKKEGNIMNKTISKVTSLLVVISLVFSVFLAMDTKAVNTQLSLGDDSLVDWILDRESHSIIAITSQGNLHFISLDTFTITDTYAVGNNPTDLERSGNSLYISLPDFSMIKVFDIVAKGVVEEVKTTQQPYRVAVGSEKLFYVENEYSDLFAVDFASKQEVKVTILGENYSSFYKPELVVDNDTNTLFIAETNLSGSNIQAISTVDYKLKGETTFNDGYGFSYPKRHFIVDGKDIFFAGYKINSETLEEIHGVYAEDYNPSANRVTTADIIAMDEQYVYSTTSVFNRNTFKKVGLISAGTTHVLVSGESKYFYNANNHTIQEVNPTYTEPTVETNTMNNKLLLNQEVHDWVVDESNQRIFALSEGSNELLTIDTNTMTILERRVIGAIPTDIELINNQLYIALSGATKIAVVGTELNAPIQYILTKQNPFEIETDGANLYYLQEDQFSDIYCIDLNTKVERVIEPSSTPEYDYYEASINLDSKNKLLYVGESGSSGSHLYAINLVDGSKIQSTDFNGGYGFPYPGRNVLMDDNYLYYAGYRLNKSNIADESGKYFDQPETFVSLVGNYIFSTKGIYQKDTMQIVYKFPTDIVINQAYMDKEGKIILSVPSKKAIYKFDSISDLKSLLVKNLEVTSELNKYTLSWDVMTGDGYNLYVNQSGTDTYTKLNTTPLANPNYLITENQLKGFYGNTVSFGVKSLFGIQESTAMNVVKYTFDIPVPTNIQSRFEDVPENLRSQFGDTFYTVSWDLNPLMDGYYLYYYTSDNSEKKKINISQMPDNQVSFTKQFFDNWAGKTVYFEVTAQVNGKESNASETHSYTFKEVTNPITNEEEVIVAEPEKNGGIHSGEIITNDKEQAPLSSQPVNDVKKTIITDISEVENVLAETTNANQTKEVINQSKSIPVSASEKPFLFTLEDFYRFSNGSNLEIDITNELTDEVTLSDTLLRKLVQEGRVISIKRKTVQVALPSIIFSGREFETNINLSQLENRDGAISDIYDFTITQGDKTISQFTEPVTLHFSVEPTKVTNPENVKLYYWNEEKEVWELIGGTYKDGIVTAETSHFSTYAVFEKETKEAVEVSQGDISSSKNETSSIESSNTLLTIIGSIAILLAISIIFVYRKNRKLH